MTDKHITGRVSVAWSFCRERIMPVVFLLFLIAPFLVNSRAALKTTTYLLLVPALFLLCDLRYLWRCVRRQPLLPLLLGLLFYLAASQWWAVEQDPDLDAFKRLAYVGLFVYAIGFNLRVDERWLWWCTLAGAAACALGAVLSITGGEELRMDGRLMAYNIGINPLLSGNLYAGYLVILMGWLGSGRINTWRCVLALVIALPILVFVVATGSRSPMLGLLCALLVVGLLASERHIRYVIGVILLTGSVVAMAMPNLVLERGFSLRPDIWYGAIVAGMESPWFGHGAGSPFSYFVAQAGITIMDTHNTLLAVFYYTGFTGLIAWLGLFLALCWQLLLHCRKRWVAVWTLAYLAYGATTLFFEGSGLLSRPNEFWYQLWLPLALAFYVLNSRQALVDEAAGRATKPE